MSKDRQTDRQTRANRADWNPSLAQSSDFHWPAELRDVRPRNLNSLPPSLRAPELSLSTFKRLLKTQLFPARVNHRPAPLWLNSEFGAAYKYLDPTQLNSSYKPSPASDHTWQKSSHAIISGGARTSRQPGNFQVTKVARQVIRCKRQRSKGTRSFQGQKILKPGHRMHFFPQKS